MADSVTTADSPSPLVGTSSTLPTNTEVVVHALEGNVIFRWQLASSQDRDTTFSAVLIAILGRYRLPDYCGSIEWTVTRDELTVHCHGSMIWRKLSEEALAELTTKPVTENGTTNTMVNCFVCGVDCVDAELTVPFVVHCVRCIPLDLCEDCKIQVPTEFIEEDRLQFAAKYFAIDTNWRRQYLCYLCISQLSGDQRKSLNLNSLHRRRLYLLTQSAQSGMSSNAF